MIDEDRKARAKAVNVLELAKELGFDVNSNKMLCPFHEEKTPSCSYNPRTNTFHCFGCSKEIDAIDLMQKATGASFQQAINQLLGTEQYQRPTVSLGASVRATNASGELFSDIYEFLLSKLPYPEANHYLARKRRLSVGVLKENNIRAVDLFKDGTPLWEEQSKLIKYLIEGFPIERLIASGVLVLNKSGNGYHLFCLKCCAIIPFYEDGKIIYLQGRVREDLELTEKDRFRNLKSILKPSLYFPKNFPNYNPKTDCISIVEGAIDTLSSIELNRKAIGVIDVGASDFRKLKNIKDFPIILIGDGDKAGFNLKVKLYEYLMSENFVLQSENIKSIAKNMLQKGLTKNTNTDSVKDMNDVLKLIKKEN